MRLNLFAGAIAAESVAAITDRQIEDYLQERREAMAAGKGHQATYNQDVMDLRKFFCWARDQRLRPDNPATRLQTVRVPRKRPAYHTARECESILRCFQEPRSRDFSSGRHNRKGQSFEEAQAAWERHQGYEAAVAVAIGCGLRLGEIRRLAWADINLRARKLVVEKSKTNRPRTVPVPAWALEILRRCRPRGGKGLVPVPGHGGIMRLFLAWLRMRADVATATWGIWRHTYGSLLAQNNVSLYKISKWMGHSSFQTTVTHYAELQEGYDAAAEQMGITLI